MVEMLEANNALRFCNRKFIDYFDEIGRGLQLLMDGNCLLGDRVSLQRLSVLHYFQLIIMN